MALRFLMIFQCILGPLEESALTILLACVRDPIVVEPIYMGSTSPIIAFLKISFLP